MKKLVNVVGTNETAFESLLGKEDVVANYLSNLGYTVSTVENSSSKGFDIVAIKDNRNFLIEVKTAIKDGLSYKIKPVSKRNEICDFLAVVTPLSNIHFIDMQDYLSLNKNSSKSVTKVVRLLDGR